MTIHQQIEDLYARFPQPRSFAEEVEAHAWHGFVLNLPDLVMLARPVDIFDPQERWRDPHYIWTRERQNCWFITLYCGISQNNPCNYAPYALDFAAWSRRGKPLRVYPTEKLRTICDTLIHSQTLSCTRR
jgi:hypothetical protein